MFSYVADMHNQDIVRNILAKLGNQYEVAEKLNTSQSNVSQWIKRGKIPAWRWEEIIRQSRGLVNLQDLSSAHDIAASRPDSKSEAVE